MVWRARRGLRARGRHQRHRPAAVDRAVCLRRRAGEVHHLLFRAWADLRARPCAGAQGRLPRRLLDEPVSQRGAAGRQASAPAADADSYQTISLHRLQEMQRQVPDEHRRQRRGQDGQRQELRLHSLRGMRGCLPEGCAGVSETKIGDRDKKAERVRVRLFVLLHRLLLMEQFIILPTVYVLMKMV